MYSITAIAKFNTTYGTDVLCYLQGQELANVISDDIFVPDSPPPQIRYSSISTQIVSLSDVGFYVVFVDERG